MGKLVDKVATKLDVEATADLFAWIDEARRVAEPFFEKMERWRRMYRGREIMEEAGDPDEMSWQILNFPYLHIRTLIPTIYARDPYVEVEPPYEEHATDAPVFEGVINETIRRIRFKEEMKAAAQDAGIYAEGWVKCGWEPHDEDEQPRASSRPLDLLGGVLQGEGLERGPNGSLRPPRAQKSLERPESRARQETGSAPTVWLKSGSPYITTIPAFDVLVDPLVPERDPTRARFIAIRYLRPLSELRATKHYKIPKVIDKTKLFRSSRDVGPTLSTIPDTTPGYPRGVSALPESEELAVVWEVWAYQLVELQLYKQMVVLMEGAEEPIRDPVDWADLVGEDVDGYPIKRFAMNRVPGQPPMSEFEAWSSLHRTVNWLAMSAVDQVKRYTPKYAVLKGALNSEKEMVKLERGKTGTPIEINEKGAVEPIAFPNVGSDVYALLGMLTESLQLVSGISENRKGSTSGSTATEAAIVEASTKVRLEEKADAMADFALSVVYTLTAIIKKFVDRPYVTRLTGSGGAVQWLRFSPENISWMPDLRIRFESTRFANEQKQLQKLQTVLALSMQLFAIMPNIRLDIIYANLLKELGIPNVSEIVGGLVGPSPREDQLAEIIVMLSGTPVEPKLGEPHRLHIQVLQELMGTEQWRVIEARNPDGAALVNMHLMGHQMMEAQLRSLGEQMASSSRSEGLAEQRDVPDATQFSEANRARGERVESPETARSAPGMGNQMMS